MPNIPFQALFVIYSHIISYHLVFLFKLLLCDTYGVYGDHYPAQ